MTADYFLYTVGIVVPKTVTRIRIHHSVKHIPDFAFFDCTNLVEVDFHEGLYSIEIGNSAFKNCSSLRRCNIPSSVRTIGVAAFYACTAMVEVELRVGLRTIGRDAFMNCRSLLHIIIPSSVRSISVVHSSIVVHCAAAIFHHLSPSFTVVHFMPVLHWLRWSFMRAFK